MNLGRSPLKISVILEMVRVSFSPFYPKGHRTFQEGALPEVKAWRCETVWEFGN